MTDQPYPHPPHHLQRSPHSPHSLLESPLSPHLSPHHSPHLSLEERAMLAARAQLFLRTHAALQHSGTMFANNASNLFTNTNAMFTNRSSGNNIFNSADSSNPLFSSSDNHVFASNSNNIFSSAGSNTLFASSNIYSSANTNLFNSNGHLFNRSSSPISSSTTASLFNTIPVITNSSLLAGLHNNSIPFSTGSTYLSHHNQQVSSPNSMSLSSINSCNKSPSLAITTQAASSLKQRPVAPQPQKPHHIHGHQKHHSSPLSGPPLRHHPPLPPPLHTLWTQWATHLVEKHANCGDGSASNSPETSLPTAPATFSEATDYSSRTEATSLNPLETSLNPPATSLNPPATSLINSRSVYTPSPSLPTSPPLSNINEISLFPDHHRGGISSPETDGEVKLPKPVYPPLHPPVFPPIHPSLHPPLSSTLLRFSPYFHPSKSGLYSPGGAIDRPNSPQEISPTK